ncbi:SDR family oxidoreductase [Micromonospora antibiotica]|uniref:SDR family oxidoreductase n=1 Tax=Micromonospora antibiotica TaxID=2807623 RepID=A0ABS3VCE8_9ACTN|nr:SDR family oxidoreductase [Micromonospora antibiotica]MBO4163269.1 SDR family oxidoreductase [Micromonospora antibiotica]
MTDHVLTGATGFVGSHLLTDLLLDDTALNVSALARGNSRQPASDRVHAALDEAGGDLPPARRRMTVVESELTEPRCGVAPDAVRRGAGPLVFWHLAASLQWRRGQREQVFRTNVEGTRHALELATELGADLFVYVSTAFTCGTLHGEVPEALHRPPRFSNVYEESKCAAEHLVAGFDGPRRLILRPSIITGTSHDYRPSGSYTGLYGFLSELRKFREMLGDSDESVRFTADRSTRLSFIPVDHVVADLRAIVAAEMASPRQDIYHVSGRSEAATGDILDYMLKLLGLEDRLFVINESFDDPSTLERFFAKRIDFFSEYLRREKRFVRTAAPERAVPLAELVRFIDAENAL